MIIKQHNRREGRGEGTSKKEKNQKILISSRFHYYEPSSNSLNVPVMVFDDTSSIDYEIIKACVVSIKTKVMFIMASNYNYYIVAITDAFIKLIQNYKQIIIADKTIYSGKEDSNPGAQIPLYINE